MARSPGVRRRSLLAWGALSAGALAGCSIPGVLPGSAAIASVSLLNYDTSPHTVELVLLEDGERVFGERYELPAAAPESGDVPGRSVEGDWPRRNGRFELRAVVDGRTERGQEVPDERKPGDCYAITVRIREGPLVDVPIEEDAEGCSG